MGKQNKNIKDNALEIETPKNALGDGGVVVRFCKALHEQGYRFEKGDKVSKEPVAVIEAFGTIQAHIAKLADAFSSLYDASDAYVAVATDDVQDKPLHSALSLLAGLPLEQHLAPMQKACKKLLSALHGQHRPIAKADTPEARAALRGLSTIFERSYSLSNSWRLCKANAAEVEHERYVLGVVMEPNDGSDGSPENADTDGDIYSPEEVRKAAHWYMENGKHHGLLHGPDFGGEILPLGDKRIVLLENWVTPVPIPAGALADGSIEIKKGTWLMSMRINDDAIWSDVLAGKLNGLSVGGVAREYPINAEGTGI